MVGSFSAVTDVGDRREVSSLFIRTCTVKVMAYLRGDVALGRGVNLARLGVPGMLSTYPRASHFLPPTFLPPLSTSARSVVPLEIH